MDMNKSSLHATVEGFMTGLKALPKGSPERGKFITSHMSHGPFIGALQAHPQGKQVHSMLTNHLNSASNAGFKAGQAQTMAKDEEVDKAETKVSRRPSLKDTRARTPRWETRPGDDSFQGHGNSLFTSLPSHIPGAKGSDMSDNVKKDEDLEQKLDKAVGFKDKAMASQASADAHRAFTAKPVAAKPHKQTLPSPEEHAARASMFADFMPPAGMKKDVNGSYEGITNVVKGEEKIALSKNGQWSIEKVEEPKKKEDKK